MSSNTSQLQSPPVTEQETNFRALITLITVFFFWGFVAASNDILIPVFKKTFNLTQSQSQLVSLAFYIAYTVGSLIYLGISKIINGDLVNKLGYKNSLVTGLTISALGTLLFIPAANTQSFGLMLSALFTVAIGFSLQQTVANPLAISMGPRATGSNRLIMAGGINNLGTTIGPLIVSFAIFGAASSASSDMDIQSVKIPYLVLGVAFLVVALILKLSPIPDRPVAEEASAEAQKEQRSSALKYPQLVLGMIAIFVYVGVEVATASNLPEYMLRNLGKETKDIAPFISLYWASLMIGRWTGATEALTNNISTRKVLKFLLPYMAFGVFLLVNAIAQHDLSVFYLYAAIILVLIAADFFSKGDPANMLLIFSGLGILSLIIGMLSSGMVSVYAFISVGLFCSTLWPCIFTLAISGLGKHTSQGSSYLIMMIMGGGIISWLQGFVSDLTTIHFSYIVGVCCFAYLAFYAVKAKSILAAQGIEFTKATGGH